MPFCIGTIKSSRWRRIAVEHERRKLADMQSIFREKREMTENISRNLRFLNNLPGLNLPRVGEVCGRLCKFEGKLTIVGNASSV